MGQLHARARRSEVALAAWLGHRGHGRTAPGCIIRNSAFFKALYAKCPLYLASSLLPTQALDGATTKADMQKKLSKSLFGNFDETALRACTSVTEANCSLEIQHEVTQESSTTSLVDVSLNTFQPSRDSITGWRCHSAAAGGASQYQHLC